MPRVAPFEDPQEPHNEFDDMRPSEREEAFWCRIVLLEHRLTKLEEENRNLRELVDLQREKLSMASMFTPPKRERKKHDVVNRQTHTAMLKVVPPVDPARWNMRLCQLPECHKKVTHAKGKYCCHGHGLKHRWAVYKSAQEAKHANVAS